MIKAWGTRCDSANPIDCWQTEVRAFRRLAKGWNRNVEAALRRNKELMEEYDDLDIKSESGGLTDEDNERLGNILHELSQMWQVEEIKARQRSREKRYC